MIIKKVINAKKFIDGTKDMLGEKIDSTKTAINNTKAKLSQYNVKKVKAIAITLGVISMVLSAAALAVAIVALVKSCKARTKSKVEDYSYYIDDPDDIESYSLGVDNKKIDESDLPDDNEE
ncbi:MAG: hypothetical protein ACI4I1_09775 [Oscillospiraceae bacterium]